MDILAHPGHGLEEQLRSVATLASGFATPLGGTPALALRQALGLDSLPSLDFGIADALPETHSQEDAIVTDTA